MVDINIVIVNYKTKDDVDVCLSSLFREIKNTDLDIAVQLVDNSANVDGVHDLIEEKYSKVNYLDSGGNIGFGKAQNLGLEKVKAKYYLALNPDVEFIEGQNTLVEMIEYLKNNPDVGVVGPKTLNIDGSVQLSCSRSFGVFDQIARRLNFDKRSKYFRNKIDRYLMKDFDHDRTVDVDWLVGSFLFFRSELAERIGFFDDRFFMYFEDCDLCRRSWESGLKVAYICDVKIKHKHKRDSDVQKPIISIFTNRVTRIHIKSWMKYMGGGGGKKKGLGE